MRHATTQTVQRGASGTRRPIVTLQPGETYQTVRKGANDADVWVRHMTDRETLSAACAAVIAAAASSAEVVAMAVALKAYLRQDPHGDELFDLAPES
jgi:hypothetical protein